MTPAPASLERARTGRGPRLVLVHGFTQTGDSFRHLVPHLARSHEVCTIDLPGHGRSGTIEAASLEETAALVGRSTGRAAYLGYSLGGRVCLTLALESPGLVERLVLVGASPGIDDPRERAERRASDAALARRLAPEGGGEGPSIEAFVSEWLAGPLFSHLRPEQADVAARLENRPAGLAASLRATGAGTQRPSRARLSGLEMPVLLVAGERDAKFAALAEEMAAAVGANARVARVPRAGHAACFEEPRAFLALVEGFLAD